MRKKVQAKKGSVIILVEGSQAVYISKDCEVRDDLGDDIYIRELHYFFSRTDEDDEFEYSVQMMEDFRWGQSTTPTEKFLCNRKEIPESLFQVICDHVADAEAGMIAVFEAQESRRV